MKKFFSLFAVAALALSITACGGNTSNNNASTEGEAAEAEVQVETAAEEQGVLAKYETLINKTIELQGKIQAGDADAIQEYVKISEDMAAISEQLSTELANMTPEQAQRVTELNQKLANAASAQ